MSFLNPIFLFAIAAVGLPLVIHLLNLRKPKKVQFSTLAFFKELQKTTIRKIKIKRFLLLALRVLAIICLAMVLARPFLPPALSSGATANQPTVYAILVDNSISMSRIGSKGPLLDQAKELIQTILDSSGEDDRFVLQATNGESLNASILSKSQVENRLDQLQITKSGAFISERLNLLITSLEDSPLQNKKLYMIDDQNPEIRTVLNEDLSEDIQKFATTMLNVKDVDIQNTFISGIGTSSSMVGKGIPFSLEVSVQNSAEVVAANQFLTLTVNGETIGQYSLELDPGEVQQFSFEINPSKSGPLTGSAVIEGDGFIFDNEYFFSIQIPEKRNILWIRDEQTNRNDISYTSAILDAQGDGNNQIDYTGITPDEVTATTIAEYDALIIEEIDEVPEFIFSSIQDFVQAGKGVVFFPSPTASIRNYNSFLSLFNAGSFVGLMGDYTAFNSVAKGSVLLEDHPVFDGLFDIGADEQLSFTVPDIYYYLKLQTNSFGLGLNIIEMNNGDPLLREKKYGEGKILIYTIGNDPGWSNFPVKALYAPTYYRSILYASSLEEGGLNNTLLGKEFEWKGNANPETTELIYNEESIQVNPRNIGSGISLTYTGYDWEPGWITITDGDKTYVNALNLNKSESIFHTSSLNEEDLSNSINIVDAGSLSSEQIANEIRTSGFGKEIWHWFMLAGFLLLITESLVSIFYKAETVN